MVHAADTAYNPNSIVGVCSLVDEDRWACVSAGGELCLGEQTALTHSWQLPEPGSPRSLAAHPDKPWLAIGIKKGGFARPQSAVVLIEVLPCRLNPAWQTPIVQAIARAADERRLAPYGCLDSATLAILADALEEAGCADTRVLMHLRRHDWRLRDCWIIDSLLSKEEHRSDAQ